MAEARSLDWIAQRSENRLNRNEIKSGQDYVAPLGYLLSSVVLRSLSAETTLKALQMLTLGYFIKTHDLLKLFNRLQPDVRYDIGIVYQRCAQALSTEHPTVINAGNSIENVLENHRFDFEEWRYVYELKDETYVNLIDLRLATKVLIEKYNALTQQL